VPADGASGQLVDGVGLASSSLGMGGLVLWAVPALALTVPGLLVVLVVVAQIVGGIAWLPVARRRIGSFGLLVRRDTRRRRRS
jgi:hypothetical protein